MQGVGGGHIYGGHTMTGELNNWIISPIWLNAVNCHACQRRIVNQLTSSSCKESNIGGEEEFPPPNMRGVPQPSLTAKVHASSFCFSQNLLMLERLSPRFSRNCWGIMKLYISCGATKKSVIFIKLQDYIIIIFMLGLWAYSIHLILRWLLYIFVVCWYQFLRCISIQRGQHSFQRTLIDNDCVPFGVP